MDTPFEGWAILELMGHRQRPGYVQEVEIAGGKMLRVDIPVGLDQAGQDRMVTEFYAIGALYALRPCAEDVVRQEARYADPRPLRPLEFKERAAPKAVTHEEGGDDDDELPL